MDMIKTTTNATSNKSVSQSKVRKRKMAKIGRERN